MPLTSLVFGAVIGLCLVIPAALADDWPQWLGPKRDSIWREEGVLDKFPADGLPVKWRKPIAGGYAGPAVTDGRVFVCDYVRQSGDGENNPGARATIAGRERILCLDAETGEVLWKDEYDCPYNISYPAGPRCTPTVEGGLVFTLGAEGDLRCYEAATGKVVWAKRLKEEYRTEAPMWGFSAHPLVDGERLFCVVGGRGSVAVAFDKRTGKELWRALSASEPGYCPPTMIEAGGARQLLIWHPESLNSLNPEDGSVYWSIRVQPQYGMAITAPRRHGDYLYVSGIGSVAALLKLDANKPGAEVEWRGSPTTAVYCANSTPFLEEGVIYGADCQVGDFKAADLATGERLWQTFDPTSGTPRRASHGTAFVVRHRNGFFLFSETGDLILADLSRNGYKEISRFHLLEPTNEAFGRPVVWSHPAFANRCVYARNDKEIVCVSLAKE